MLNCHNCTARKQFQLKTAENCKDGELGFCYSLCRFVLAQVNTGRSLILTDQWVTLNHVPLAGNSKPRYVNDAARLDFQRAAEKANKNVKPQTKFWKKKKKQLHMILN